MLVGNFNKLKNNLDMKKIIFVFMIGLFILSSCENQDKVFEDYKYTTVYFAYQSPVRTLILGSDYVYDNSLDTAHQCMIYATLGGVYSNTVNRTLDIVVDNSLCSNLTFTDASGSIVQAMPSTYYTLASSQIVIPSGSIMGGVKVQLNDAFFADPLAVSNNYVIPLKITNVTGADSILSGAALVTNPNYFITSDWSTVSKNYILYAIKYKNKWDAVYLRRGREVGSDTTVTYHEEYVEYDDVISSAATKSLTQLSISMNATTLGNVSLPFELLLDFAGDGSFTISNPASVSDYTISGSGKYVKDGDSWGNKSRDVLYLNYNYVSSSINHTMTDTLVMRDRAEGLETFTPYYNE
jgi:hypothetical protein